MTRIPASLVQRTEPRNYFLSRSSFCAYRFNKSPVCSTFPCDGFELLTDLLTRQANREKQWLQDHSNSHTIDFRVSHNLREASNTKTSRKPTLPHLKKIIEKLVGEVGLAGKHCSLVCIIDSPRLPFARPDREAARLLASERYKQHRRTFQAAWQPRSVTGHRHTKARKPPKSSR